MANNDLPHISSDAIKTIDVNLSDKVSFDSVATNLKCVKLETNDSSLFSSVSKIRVYKNKLYLLDGFHTNLIYIYDTNGNHLKTINNVGRAYNEFIKISNFELDYITEQLIIHDDAGRKLMYYDLDGNFKNCVPVKWRLQDYAVLSNGCFIRARNTSSYLFTPEDVNLDQVLIFSDTISAIDKVCDLHFSLYNSNYLVSTFNGDAILLPHLSDTIYTVTKDGYYPSYKINIKPSDKIDIDILSKQNDFSYLDTSEDNGKVFTWGCLAQNDNNIHCMIGFSGSQSLFYSKKSGNSIVIDERLFQGAITSDESGQFWGYINPIYLGMSKGEYAKEILQHVNEEDNPVLICFYLKDF